MISFGLLEKISIILFPIFKNLGLDSLGISYIAASIISPRIAYGIAKIMLGYNYSIYTILGCMFLGNGWFVLTYEWWTRILPYYTGLYPKDVALKLLIIQAFLPSIYCVLLGIFLLKLAT